MRRIKAGDLVCIVKSRGGLQTGIAVEIWGEWDDGEPPGMVWTDWVDVQFSSGEIETWDMEFLSFVEPETPEQE